MTDGTLEAVLRRDRLIVAGALGVIAVLAWAYVLWLAADMDMGGMNMSGFRMVPAGMGMMTPAATPWSAVEFAFVFVMWAVMMVGMMAPSAAPMILMYARVGRQGRIAGKPLAATGWFAAGYLLAWAGFSLAATLVQWALERAALLDVRMASANIMLGAVVLIAVGIYQWTPLKNACLAECHSPFRFLMSHGGFRSDVLGCLRLGFLHGTYCVGCCWVLMALLFVVGVMNVLWIALLALLVLLEKLTPRGRWVARGAGVVSIAAGVWMLSGASSAHAAAPLEKAQAPGFYRMMLGDFEVTALNDGVIAYTTAQVLPDATPEQIKTALSAAGLSDPVGMSYNAFLINTGSKLVLIDTGTGGKLDESPLFHGAGRLLANLRAAGYEPEQVDEVCITHVGPDHIGGLTVGSKRTFPNAMLRAAKSEVDFYLNSDAARQSEIWFRFRSELFDPYIKAGRFTSFDGDVAIVPGIRALATPGHTPGHTSYVVESKGQTLVVMGDLVLVGALQFADPALSSPFDADRNAAVTQRTRILKLAADQDYWIAGAHLSFPGIGHVRRNQLQYSWSPINYAVVQ
jgi:predicted metal-binding membrane protein/glyoxylase-like metal-dependent hydrolase (beta-lactamase superfamily II)